MEEKKKVNKAPLIVAVLLLLALVVCLSLLAIRLINNGKKFVEENNFLLGETPAPTVTMQAEMEPTEEPMVTKEAQVEMPKASVTTTAVDFNVYRYLEGDVYIAQKSGYYGMTDMDGNWLIAPQYAKFVYYDDEWVSFEDDNEVTHVFDRTGTKLYEYICEEGIQTAESGRQFWRAVFYRKGMKIVFDYNDEDGYYGIHYYSAETDELIFELTDDMVNLPEENWPDLQITSLPDESGTAVVIAGDGFYNVKYLITRDGWTQEEYREENVERRQFYYSSHAVWNRTNLIDGWLLATIEETRGEILNYSEEWMELLYHIHTNERVPLPEEYQNWYSAFYQHSAGTYYGISGESYYDYEEGRTDVIYYAICHGSTKLTDEIYGWINFGEKYIIAGNNSFSHILDYSGTVLAEYQDVAFPFVDGKTLVCDDIGAFYIDENLQPCSGYVMMDVAYCHPGYIRKGNKNYLVKWLETEE